MSSQSFQVIGYVFTNGMYEKKYFIKASEENIADFILNFTKHKVTITDTADNLIVKANYGYLDNFGSVYDQQTRNASIREFITKKQVGLLKVNKLFFKEDEYSFIQK